MPEAKSRLRPVVYHIPVCPFSQRLEILLEIKGLQDELEFRVIDITRPRDPALLEKTRGSTEMPVLETEGGAILRESLVILRYLEERFAQPPVARADPLERAVENMLIAREGSFGAAGYRLVMNREPERRAALTEAMEREYAWLDDFLLWQAPDGDFLFPAFGLAETVYTPFFARFAFLEYYEGFTIPAGLRRVRRWHDACLAHPAAQQVSREEIIKLYYDYAQGKGNGALPEGRARSSLAFDPPWQQRPWPPRDKYDTIATDAELGLTP